MSKSNQKSPFQRIVSGQLPLETETAQFILVNLVDFFMTYLLLASGRFREANPVAEYFLNHWGPIKGMLYFKLALITFVCILTQIIALKSVEKAAFVLRLGTAGVAIVVVYSLILFIRSS